MRILAIANHKGGTGKTATTRALGDVLAGAGFRVLLVDIDPQASLTTSCGLGDADIDSMADVLGGAQPGRLTLAKVIRPVKDQLDIAPASLALAAVELGLNNRLGREHILAKALQGVANDYDIALIDCPPSLSLLVVNALAAAQAVLIPCQPMPVDVAGVRLFLDTLGVIRENLNPGLSVLGILITFYDSRLIAHAGAIEAMGRAKWPVLPVRIGRSVKVGEGAALGESIMTYEPENPQAANYQKLGELVIKWLKSKS